VTKTGSKPAGVSTIWSGLVYYRTQTTCHAPTVATRTTTSDMSMTTTVVTQRHITNTSKRYVRRATVTGRSVAVSRGIYEHPAVLKEGSRVENSRISWTKNTFNPWMGCTKVSAACDNCYAERDMDHRFGRVKWGAGQPRVRTSEANWRKPLSWDRDAEKHGTKYKVFCASLADVFDGEQVSDLNAWRSDLWALIEATPNLYWLLLTKRPQNIMRMVPPTWRDKFPDHVWVGASTENQAMFDLRVPVLLQVPAKVRFLSCEPLLGPLVMDNGFYDEPYQGRDELGMTRDLLGADGINWVIAGGESGPGWRPMEMDWVRGIRDQCVAADVPFFLKQTSGAHPEKEPVLDGRQWMECPEERFEVVAAR
jgi:protein gp37